MGATNLIGPDGADTEKAGIRMRKWTRVRRISVYGAPVYVHWSVAVVVFLLALTAFDAPIYALLSIASYLAVIFIHEVGHAYVVDQCGYRVETIRISMIHGVCEHEQPYYEWQHVRIAWGGVAAQLCVGVPVIWIASLLGSHDVPYFGPIMVFLGYVNLFLALMNLTPAHPFDGKVAWRVIPLFLERWRGRRF